MKLIRRILTVVISLIFLLPLTARAGSEVPKLVNFQAVLRDDNGNIVTDGFLDIQINILNQAGTPVYRETQPGVQIVNGAVNIMIGEGIEPGSSPGKPTGGIPFDALDPAKGTRFLQIQFGPNQPSDPMELGSIPYAMYAQKAIGIVPDITEAEVPAVFVTESELTGFSANIVTTINNSSTSITINETHIDQTITRDSEADAKYVNVTGDTMTGSLTVPSLQVNGNIGVTGTVDGVDVSSLDSAVSNHETRITNLENTSMTTCAISIHSNIIDGSTDHVTSDDCECRIYGMAVDFGSSATAMSGLVSVTNMQDDGVSEKSDQNNVLAIRDDTPSKMLFLLAHSCSNNPSLGGMAIGLVPGSTCPAPTEQPGANLTFLVNNGVQNQGNCIIKPGDIALAKSSL